MLKYSKVFRKKRFNKKMDDSLLCIKDRQEPFSISYISAIATASGYGVDLNISSMSPDRKSIDLSISQNGSPIIQDLKIQAKCTYFYQPKKGYLPFKLKKKNYDDIRKNHNPHILVVINIPSENPFEWVTYNGNSTELKNNCYWYSLKGLDELKKEKESIMLHIPLTNRFDGSQLSKLMNLLYEGKVDSSNKCNRH